MAKISLRHLPEEKLACIVNPSSGSPRNQIIREGSRGDWERDIYFFVGERSVPPRLLRHLSSFISKIIFGQLRLPKATNAFVCKTKRGGNKVLLGSFDIGLVINTKGIGNLGNNINTIRLPTFTGRYE